VTPLTSYADADWLDPARRRSMAAHPAGKGDPVRASADRRASDHRLLAAHDMGAALTGSPFLAPQLPDFDEEVYEVVSELAATLISKQADYGPRAISQAPGGATLGVLVRAHDKLERLAHLTAKDGLVAHESIRDSWLDLAGYAVIGLMVAEGTWPS
jgi:hypothetical protein